MSIKDRKKLKRDIYNNNSIKKCNFGKTLVKPSNYKLR